MNLDDQIPFGKHRGTAIKELPVGYVDWMLDNMDSTWVEDHREVLEQRLTYVDPTAVPRYELAEDQQKASDEIFTSLFEDNNPVHRLQGGAGYGKSFACQDVVLRAKAAGYRVRACAPSYVATQNPAKDLEPLGVECGTIASTLRLDVVYDGPRETYVPGVDTDMQLAGFLKKERLLIIDEYSMVDDTIGRVLVEAAKTYGGRLLVVGDVYQLPSPAQTWDSMLCNVEPASELWIPKRYHEDSDLFQVERQVRSAPFEFNTRAFLQSSEITQVQNLQALNEAYVSSREQHPDDQHLMIWFRRRDMVASNRQLRRMLFSDADEAILPGEQLRVQRTSDFTPYYDADGERVYSGTTMTVSAVHPEYQQVTVGEMGITFRVPVYWIDVEGDRRYPVIFSETENRAENGTRGADEFNAAVAQLGQWCRENRRWKPYRAFRNCFVQVAYQYASTVHRVQGQSVDRIFTSPYALRQADPYIAAKLSFVGLTRAKRQLTCL